MAICIYPPNAEDFTTNGLGILTPLECTVEEVAAGKYELELVHPIDNTLRWAQIANGCILKVPAPVRENPLYEAPAMGEPVTITRQVWVVAGTTHGLYIRTGPGMGYKRIGVKKNGVEVLELEDADDPWKKVCVLGSGQVAPEELAEDFAKVHYKMHQCRADGLEEGKVRLERLLRRSERNLGTDLTTRCLK